MRRKGIALSVSLGILALAIAAFPSLFVEGEATGATAPGLHPTNEAAIEALLAGASQEPAVVDIPAQDQTANITPIEPQPRAAQAVTTPRGVPAGYVYWKTVKAKVTAYEPSAKSCGASADGKTSIGENAWIMDGVAADPKAIPYGCYVDIPGVGVKEVDDTGSAMRHFWRSHGRYHVDVRMKYVSQAQRWGVKNLEIKLYRKAK